MILLLGGSVGNACISVRQNRRYCVAETPAPYSWKTLLAEISDYGGVLGLLLLIVNVIIWGVGIMPLWLALILSGAFGMLALIGFIGHLRVSREEPLLTLGTLTQPIQAPPPTPKPLPATSTPVSRPSYTPESRKTTPTKIAAAQKLPQQPQQNLGSGSGAPPYIERPRQPSLMWTEYKEDYFCDLIWRWRYRPEMGDQKPRDITAWCPECAAQAVPMEFVVQQKTGDRVAVFACSQCSPQRRYPVSGFLTDPYDGIRTLIATKLQNGEWKEVVKRQNDVRSGRV